MKSKFFLIGILFLFVYSYSTAQISLDDGYFILNSGEKIETKIYNQFWKYIPNTISYNKDGSKLSIDISDLKELKIRSRKFIRKNVTYDVSAKKTNISRKLDPTLQKANIWLEVLLDGEVQLYEYSNNNYNLLFWKTPEMNKIEQLIFKEYKIGRKNKENKFYRNQLAKYISDCFNNKKVISKLKYNGIKITEILKKYAQCKQYNYIEYVKIDLTAKEIFNIYPIIGIAYHTATPTNINLPVFSTEISSISPSFGAEIEFLPAFLKKKISLSVGVSLMNFSSDTFYDNPGNNNNLTGKRTTEYKSFTIPISIRYLFYLNEYQQIYTKFSSIISNVKGHINYEFDSSSIYNSFNSNISQSNNFLEFGIGFKHKKYRAELAYQIANLDKEIESTTPSPFGTWSYKNSSILSLSIGFDIF